MGGKSSLPLAYEDILPVRIPERHGPSERGASRENPGNLLHRLNLHDRIGEHDLIRPFEIRRRDGAFLRHQAALPGARKKDTAGNPRQKARRNWRGNQAPPPDQKEVRGCRLGDLLPLIEEQGIVIPLISGPLSSVIFSK